ncbi:peptidoglycan-binding protein [Bacillus sp. AFS077874]|uniref:LysM peptidoglycan-binding domain-containing protein n=1 Tax=unclassified Bacillus (in: firmicutes) TaxID=185979 RepID=UPI000BEC5A40|nr:MULTISPECIES: LysM peptidoglycan-binding domain-containing protein [unclassified Bacillus (in: firmicutes)]PEC51092.1 peptidoglycan-binding protein [Bacillus sp. AFS096315]PFM81259.1 peptidoglycan-binding protein [Bacillus sp. AFS077874]
MINKVKVTTILAAAALSVSVSANVQAATVNVKKGDTLWDLSRANNATVENTKMLNGITSDLIHPGDKLIIAPEKHYEVKKGDTLWDIAQNHDVTVSQLQEWNNIHTDLIQPGLNLVIFEGVKNIAQSKMTNTNLATNSKTTSTVKSVQESSKTVSASREDVPKTKEIVPATKESASITKESEPAAKESAPAIKESVPTTKESAPVTKESVPAAKESESKTNDSAGLKVLTMEASAYTASCKGCTGITATGINLKENPNTKVISVDPSVIPLGSKVNVEGYGVAIAGDTGGAIKGNRIDVFIPNKQDAINFGRKQVKVTILN